MSIEEVRALVAERQRYDEWLAALDARRAETPDRVYQRVRGDYDARRTDVLTRLAAHVAELETLSGTLAQQREGLSAQLDTLEDQRVEAMIRNAVGEYDNDRWETLRSDVEGQLTKLTDDRALVEMELEEIQSLLAQARPSVSATPEPEPEAQPEPEPVVLEASADVNAPGVMDGEAEALPAETLIDVDVSAETTEMAVFSVDESAIAPEAELIAVEAIDDVGLIDVAPEPAVSAGEMDDALAMFAETPMRPMTAVPAPIENLDVQFEVTDDVLPTVPPVAPAAPASASAPSYQAPAAGGVPPIDPFDDLAFLHSVIAPSGSQPAVPASTMTPPSVPTAANAAEPAKTLRCTECGTMNLPTEWYCERCGGELAAF